MITSAILELLKSILSHYILHYFCSILVRFLINLIKSCIALKYLGLFLTKTHLLYSNYELIFNIISTNYIYKIKILWNLNVWISFYPFCKRVTVAQLYYLKNIKHHTPYIFSSCLLTFFHDTLFLFRVAMLFFVHFFQMHFQ